MERPGLKRLMADVEAGLIDVIVVYKMDRLTRALSPDDPRVLANLQELDALEKGPSTSDAGAP